MYKTEFPILLAALQQKENLSDAGLAILANVPRSLIAGARNGSRVVGERQATKIGKALGLAKTQLRDFIYCALNGAHDKLLTELNDYPAEIVNHTASFLKGLGITSDQITKCTVDNCGCLSIMLTEGKRLQVEIKLETIA